MEALPEEDIAVMASGSQSSPPRQEGVARRTWSGSNIAPQGQMKWSMPRRFSRSSTDTRPMDYAPSPAAHEQFIRERSPKKASMWHFFSLLFVALPAIAALFSDNGDAIMTDVLVLAMGCLFLYWSVKWPWQWYHSAQERILDVADTATADDIAISLPETLVDATGDAQEAEVGSGRESISPEVDSCKVDSDAMTFQQRRSNRAGQSLRQYELLALVSTFLMPPAVAYLLHTIRPYLSRPSGGLVSNSNLVLFVMAAEVRPWHHLFSLMLQQTLHLQQIVVECELRKHPQHNEIGDISAIYQRIHQVEARLTEYPLSPPSEINQRGEETPLSADEMAAMINSATQSTQPQLDALNRAVRRYEKRATLQSMILDSRLQDLNNRVNDALALAAAASRLSHRPGLLSWARSSLKNIVIRNFSSGIKLLALPVTLIFQTNSKVFGQKHSKIKKKHINGEKPRS